MKQFLVTFCVLISFHLYSQDISSINSGSISNNNLIYTVGEIFVLPVSDSDAASSGIIGTVSVIEFLTTGTNEIISDNKIDVYPNPTTGSINLKSNNQEVNKVYIYDIMGQLVGFVKLGNSQQVDLKYLESGIYLIKTDNPNIQSFKIVKK